jgi:hypothetical protein
VDVIAPDAVPLQRVMGPDLGRFIQGLHEARGVRFHLGRSVEAWDGARLTASGGAPIEADCVVLGVGVRPRLALAEAAGLTVDGGVIVDRSLRTSAAGVFAAGDIARYPGPDGDPVRIEHWVAAERQGQAAALAMLGLRIERTDPPFFWSMHYDTAIRYVGHAADWDEARIEADHDALARRRREQELLEVAPEDRDRFLVGLSLPLEPEVDLDGEGEEAPVRIPHDEPHLRRRLAAGDETLLEPAGDLLDRRVDGADEKAFILAAPHGEGAV